MDIGLLNLLKNLLGFMTDKSITNQSVVRTYTLVLREDVLHRVTG